MVFPFFCSFPLHDPAGNMSLASPHVYVPARYRMRWEELTGIKYTNNYKILIFFFVFQTLFKPKKNKKNYIYTVFKKTNPEQ